MAAPVKIGLLNDMAEAAPGPGDIERWLRLAADDVIAAGRLDREIEFVHAYGLGLPSGTAAAVESAFIRLSEASVLMIVGPAIGDNALVATPLAERLRVPTLNWAGAERARGEYMFHLQVGSHEDESIVIARHLAALGARRVAVAYDQSEIGRRHLHFLQAEADIVGLNIAASAPHAPLAEDVRAQVSTLLAASPDALIYFGLGVAAPAVARAAKAFSGPRIMNTAGIRGYQPSFAAEIDGWIYVDMHADDNATLAALRQRPECVGAQPLAAAKGYDLGRLVSEAIARAPELTRDGVKEGLERIKWLPAAEGREGALLGFGKQDRGALHGRYLVLRQWRAGATVQVD
jgi:branched-chain amino acid transport system substrate-binding protein